MAIGKFQPQNNFFHYGTSIDTFWLANPDDLKRQKNNIGALIKLLPDDIHRVPELKEAMCLTDYAVLSRYPGDLEPVTEFVGFRHQLSGFLFALKRPFYP